MERRYSPLLQSLWTYADHQRRIRGAMLDQLGFGPDVTPSREVGVWSTARLLAYQAPRADRLVALLIPAPIKPAYIWDLARDASVVRRCLDADISVYLIEWLRPEADDEELGLADYADRLIARCADAVSRETKQPQLFVVGHSLGGTLAAVFASLHSDRVRGLIELEGPMYFAPDIGRLEQAVHMTRSALATTGGLINVPGSFLSLAGVAADPIEFEVEPWLDWLRSRASADASERYWRVNRWVLDEMPMPKRLFEEVVEAFYRENRFARGVLEVGSRIVDPRALTSPILAVADPRSRVVPPASVHAYRDCTGSGDVDILEYDGDIGVMLQHVGVLVGERAHKLLWPRILAWMEQRA